MNNIAVEIIKRMDASIGHQSRKNKSMDSRMWCLGCFYSLWLSSEERLRAEQFIGVTHNDRHNMVTRPWIEYHLCDDCDDVVDKHMSNTIGNFLSFEFLIILER